MIEISNLVKKFGRKRVIDELELEVKDGDFLTIFGPNGSGKTTLIKLISTLLKPSSGTMMVNGHDSGEDGIEIRKSLGLVSHETYLYEELTAKENLKFYMKLYGIPFTKEKDRELDRMLRRVGLLHRMNDKVGTFSRGMKQRLSILRATIHNPKVLLLDEPYTGLDHKARGILNEMLLGFHNEGKTIVMTTHDIDKGYAVSQRLAILVGGKIVLDKQKTEIELENLINEYGKLLEAA
jgi:ABC-type multidrug transport system ATPase subunit